MYGKVKEDCERGRLSTRSGNENYYIIDLDN